VKGISLKRISTRLKIAVSMVDGVLFDKLDCIARDLRDCDLTFGGIQVSHFLVFKVLI
jgi:hypothetical protein